MTNYLSIIRQNIKVQSIFYSFWQSVGIDGIDQIDYYNNMGY